MPILHKLTALHYRESGIYCVNLPVGLISFAAFDILKIRQRPGSIEMGLQGTAELEPAETYSLQSPRNRKRSQQAIQLRIKHEVVLVIIDVQHAVSEDQGKPVVKDVIEVCGQPVREIRIDSISSKFHA